MSASPCGLRARYGMAETGWWGKVMGCGCRWLVERPASDLTTRYQHGDNPEHVLVLNDRAMRGPACPEGHILAVEEWMLRVRDYAHPEAK